jgi:molecular chaperone GrpE
MQPVIQIPLTMVTDPSPTDSPGDAGDGAAPPASRSLEDLLKEAQDKLADQREAWLRAVADAENARKRAQNDIAAAHKYAVERLAEGLLPVCDSLEATLAAAAEASEALRSGVELTLRQLKSALEKAGVAEVNPAAGEKFDPNRHQAMAAVESEAAPNTVVAVMQKGYRLQDRVLRPALVAVAKAVEIPAGNPISGNELANPPA